MLGKIVVAGALVVVILLMILLYSTNPASAGPVVVLMVFILMYLLVLFALTFLLFLGSRLIIKVTISFAVKKRLAPLSLRRSYYFSSVIALAPIMFIAMQSVGEVGLYDIILVGLFVVIACVYISKKTV